MGKMILGIVSVLAVLVIIFYLVFDFNSELKEQIKTVELFGNNDSEGSLYISNLTRGLNYQKSFLSSSKDATENNSYVYETYPIFIGKKLDTVVVYTYRKATEPNFFNSQITIKQVELNNKSMMDLYDTYKNKGLILIE